MKKYRTALALSALPFVIAAYAAFIAPRPASIMQTDLEPDFYYNARLLNEAPSITPKISHPGTPIQLLFAGFIAAAKDPTSQSDAVRIALYLAIGLLNALVIFFFLIRAAEKLPISIQMLAVAAIVAWPSFLTHLTYAGSDSLIIAVSLPAIVLLWTPLMRGERASARDLFLCGVWCGLAVAVKLTVLPLAVALVVGAGAHILRYRRKGEKAFADLFTVPLSALLSFSLATFPFATAYPFFLKDNIWNHIRNTLTHNPILTSFALGGMIASITLSILYFKKKQKNASVDAQNKQPDFFSSGVIIALLAIFFIQTAFTLEVHGLGNNAENIGVQFRYLSPLILFLPLFIIWCGRFAQCKTLMRALIAIFSVVLSIVSVAQFFFHRAQVTARQEAHTALVAERIQRSLPAGGTLAYSFEGSPFAPRSAFHFWGNYIYANNIFDQSVLGAFPHETLFQMRTAHEILLPHAPQIPEMQNAQSPLQKLRARFIAQNPLPYATPTNLLFAGETREVKPNLFVFPLSGENIWVLEQRDALQKLLMIRTGAVETTWRTETIGDIPYAFVTLTYR